MRAILLGPTGVTVVVRITYYLVPACNKSKYINDNKISYINIL